MKQKWKEGLYEKKDGTHSSFVVMLVCFVASFIIILMMAYLTTDINRVQKVEQIGREYLLRMESDGYLTPSDQSALISDLQSLGYVSNISVTAPMNEVGYGEKITLRIEYDLQVENMRVTDLFDASKETQTMRKTFLESTTSKH